MNSAPPRRRLFRRRDFLAAGTAATLGLYTRFIEPYRPVLTRTSIPLLRSPGPPLRLLHLSDLHASRVVPLDYLEDCLKQGLAQNPDLCLLTGDYITSHNPVPGDYHRVLSLLSAAVPTYASLGNHDVDVPGTNSFLRMIQLLQQSGITCLHNAHRYLSCRGHPLLLTGVGDLWTGDVHPEIAFPPAGPSAATALCLCHNPDAKTRLEGQPWDLLLCGHSHGGQVKLPLIGAPVQSIQDHRYAEGLHPWRDRLIYTTRGLGCLHGIRFNCPPEITLLDLSSTV